MPDKTIALNFFQLAPLNENANPEIHSEQLKKISEIFLTTPQVFNSINLSESRIGLYGQIEKRGDFYLGTLIRNQISSIPPSYDESSSLLSKLPLTENQGLAYQTSFLYYPVDRIAMIESIKNGVGISTLCDFLNRNYDIDPIEPLIVINPSKLEEFYNMTYISTFRCDR